MRHPIRANATTLRSLAAGVITLAVTAGLCSLVLPSAGASGSSTSAPSSTGASLLFAEDFNGSALDAARWHTCHWWAPMTCSIEPNHELELYTENNVSVADGLLKLQARREPAIAWNGNPYAYTSGMVSSGGIAGTTTPGFTFTYGYMEARVKIPAGQGLWPAFWALPDDHTWPPEIDAMEILGHKPNEQHMTYHWANPDGSRSASGGSWTGPDFSAGFHTFGVDWQPDSITWYVDGVERRRFTDASVITAKAHYVLLNLAVGGDWPGAPDATTTFPADMLVDWVRVWDRFPGAEAPAEPAGIERLAGADRIGTSVAISKAAWADGAASAAVLARSDNFPDALAGTPLAGAKGGPLLLTPGDQLDERIRAEVRRAVRPGAKVYLLGGNAALSDATATTLRGDGFSVVRLGGANRYATAVAVASEGLGNPSSVVLVTGTTFPDALSAGAASKSMGVAGQPAAILLTADRQMATETADWLAAHPPLQRFAVGGAAATATPGAVSIAGKNRYETAQLVAERFFGFGAVVALASGTSFADALSGGAHALNRGLPLLLTDPGALPESTRAYLEARRAAIEKVVVYGGPAALSPAVTTAVSSTIS